MNNKNAQAKKKPVDLRPVYLADLAIDVWKWMTRFYDLDQALIPPFTISTKSSAKANGHAKRNGTPVPESSAVCGSLITEWYDNKDGTDTYPFKYHVYVYSRNIERHLKETWGTARLPREILEVTAAHVVIHEFRHFISLHEKLKNLRWRGKPARGRSELVKYSDWIGGEADERANETLAMEALRCYILRYAPGAEIANMSPNTPVPRLWSPYALRLRESSQAFKLAHDAALVTAALNADFLGASFKERENLTELLSEDSTFFADIISEDVKTARKSKVKWKYSEGLWRT